MLYLKKSVLLCFVLFCSTCFIYAQKTGVMIMAHGGSPEWESLVKEAAHPISQKYPLAFAWGMADPITLQQAVSELEAQGVTRIISVPLFISSYSVIIRQTEFLLGLRNKLVDPPMIMSHHPAVPSMDSHMMHSAPERNAMNMDHNMHKGKNDQVLKPIKTKAQLIMTSALDDNDVVAQILDDRIAKLSVKPSRETVILVAHGPNDETDNQHWIESLESLSMKIQKIQERKDKAYKQIFSVTVRDDADKGIFEQAKENLRALVRQSGEFGRVIVIPVFLSSNGRENAVAERLEGLNFEWDGKTLLPDKRLNDFISNSVNDALSKK